VSENLPFESVYRHGFARIAACTIPVAIADPATNAAAVLASAREAHDEGVAVAVFPELCLTGYAIDDLVMQDAVLDATEAAILAIVRASEDLLPVLVVGAPLRVRNRLYNCAVVIHRGEVMGVVPKTYLPTYREFYERRWYASGPTYDGVVRLGGSLEQGGIEAMFGSNLLFRADDVPGLVLAVEICEDLWVPVPPSSRAALAGPPSSRTSRAARSRSRAPKIARPSRSHSRCGVSPPTPMPLPARANRRTTSRGTARR